MDQEAPHTKAPPTEQPDLRKVSEEKLREILDQHRKWVESDKKEGQRADLSKADLQGRILDSANLQGAILYLADLRGADLIRANLQGADLGDANLQGAILSEANLQRGFLAKANLKGAVLGRANLQGADLIRANLQGAYLLDAKLQGANLFGANLKLARLSGADLQGAYLRGADLRGAALYCANLREATLQDAKFRKQDDDETASAKSMQVQHIAGADVSLATLPEDIHKFEGLGNIEEASKNARKIFITTLLGCVYSWLTIATTTDARLLTNSSSSPLPIIQAPVPIAGFYCAAPVLLLCIFVYLHLYLQRLWESLAEMPAVFPDGQPLDKKAYPWLLTGLVRAHFKLLRKDRPRFSRLQTFISVLLSWWLGPFTLLLFWWRYLPRRDDWLWLHAALVVMAIGSATWFHLSMRRTLRGQARERLRDRWRETVQKTKEHIRAKAWGSFLRYPIGPTLPALLTLFVALLFYGLTPWAMEQRPANFAEADVSTKPPNWTGTGKEEEINLVKGAKLRFRDLRNARARVAFLVKADLHDADLQGAVLIRADLQEAVLSSADLRGADLFDANLQGAFLYQAKLQGANLHDADLQGAELPAADLRGADLFDANLQGASLWEANLQGAVLDRANLQGANVVGAKGLFVDKVHRAAHWRDACYSPGMIKRLNADTEHNDLACEIFEEKREASAQSNPQTN